VLVDPVGAGEGAGQTGGDTVAGAVDAVFGVEVDFGDDTSHIDALVVAHTTALSVRYREIWKSLDSDVVLADGTLISLSAILEDVIAVVQIIGIHISGTERASKSGRSKENGGKDGGSCEMHFENEVLKLMLNDCFLGNT